MSIFIFVITEMTRYDGRKDLTKLKCMYYIYYILCIQFYTDPKVFFFKFLVSFCKLIETIGKINEHLI